MENWKKALLGGTALVGAGLLTPDPAEAQVNIATPVTQTTSRPDAATQLSGPTGGRTTCSTSQDSVANLTVTLTPQAGYFVYVTGVYISGETNATGATSTTVWSSTGLNGSPAWITPTIATAAANPSGLIQVAETYPTGLKGSAAGTAVTLVPQATTASAFLCPRVAWFQAPQ